MALASPFFSGRLDRPAICWSQGSDVPDLGHKVGNMTDVFEIIVDPSSRRRRSRALLSDKQRAAALFRVWHGVRDMIEEAERLGDSEMVHFLAVSQLLVEERISTLTSGVPAFAIVDTSRPN